MSKKKTKPAKPANGKDRKKVSGATDDDLSLDVQMLNSTAAMLLCRMRTAEQKIDEAERRLAEVESLLQAAAARQDAKRPGIFSLWGLLE